MSATVYIKISQKVLVKEADVFLGQIATVWCADKTTLGKCLAIKLYSLQEGQPQRIVGSALDIVRKIQQMDAGLCVENLGEQDFILVYRTKEQPRLLEILKTAGVCLILFFGAAFAIITFNNDVSVNAIFDQLYDLVLGTQPQGASVMEWGYVIGLPLGIMGFYNHFSARRKNADPTPLQIQMRQYEKNTNTTIIENEDRAQPKRGGKA